MFSVSVFLILCDQTLLQLKVDHSQLKKKSGVVWGTCTQWLTPINLATQEDCGLNPALGK
jgi:hypothetical protein